MLSKQHKEVFLNDFSFLTGNCWAVAYYRQWYMLMMLNGIPLTGLTIDALGARIPQLHKSPGHDLRNFQPVADFLINGGHENPFGEREDESFEKRILELLEDGPVVLVSKFYSKKTKSKLLPLFMFI